MCFWWFLLHCYNHCLELNRLLQLNLQMKLKKQPVLILCRRRTVWYVLRCRTTLKSIIILLCSKFVDYLQVGIVPSPATQTTSQVFECPASLPLVMNPIDIPNFSASNVMVIQSQNNICCLFHCVLILILKSLFNRWLLQAIRSRSASRISSSYPYLIHIARPCLRPHLRQKT